MSSDVQVLWLTSIHSQHSTGSFSDTTCSLLTYIPLRTLTRSLAAADPVERQSSRPNFQALIYPGRSGDMQVNRMELSVNLAMR